MRIGDVLYFSARFSFAELNLEDYVTLIEALHDRVDGLLSSARVSLFGIR